MAKKGKEPATQRILRGDLTPSYKVDSQDSKEPKHQEVSETPTDDITERLSETQIERAFEPMEKSKNLVGDPTRNPAVNPIGGHGGDLTRSAQL